MTQIGNVLCLVTLTFDLKINKFPGLKVKHFYVKLVILYSCKYVLVLYYASILGYRVEKQTDKQTDT